MASLSETLEEITLFRGMSEEDIESIASQTVIRQFPKNTVIVSQGDETDSFYVILQGKVDVVLRDFTGQGRRFPAQRQGQRNHHQHLGRSRSLR